MFLTYAIIWTINLKSFEILTDEELAKLEKYEL